MAQIFEKPMKHAIDETGNFRNVMAFGFRRWNPLFKDDKILSFRKWDEPMVCKYLMKRFWDLAKDGQTKSAARNAVECGKLALGFKPALIDGEATYTKVDGLMPLDAEFVRELANQCAKAASSKDMEGVGYFRKAADYNEQAAGLCGRDKLEMAAEQMLNAVENATKHLEGLEKLHGVEWSTEVSKQDIDTAKKRLDELKKKHCLAKAELGSSHLLQEPKLTVERRTYIEYDTGENYIRAGELEKGVEHLLRAGWGFALSGNYPQALGIYSYILPWASNIGDAKGAAVKVADNPWVLRVNVHGNVVSTLKQESKGAFPTIKRDENGQRIDEHWQRIQKAKKALGEFDSGWRCLLIGEGTEKYAFERFMSAASIFEDLAAPINANRTGHIVSAIGCLEQARKICGKMLAKTEGGTKGYWEEEMRKISGKIETIKPRIMQQSQPEDGVQVIATDAEGNLDAAKLHRANAAEYKNSGKLKEAFEEYMAAAEQFIGCRETEYAKMMYMAAELIWKFNEQVRIEIPNGAALIETGRAGLNR